MVIENIVNCISLFAVILGLLGCLFKYIRAPRRGYLYLVIFFLASFSSDYYWTIYSLVMHSNPDVSEFLAYIGWNVGYVFLAAAVFQMLQKEAKRYFHPLILLPVLTNLPQLLLYLQFGGVINNLLQVGMTTVVMVLCMKGVVYYLKNRKAGAKFPHLAVLTLLYLLMGYGMWTSSCFFWNRDFSNPYLYFTIISAITVTVFAWGAEKDYSAEEPKDSGAVWAEFRFQTLFQAVATFVISGACAGGYVIACRIRESISEAGAGSNASDSIITTLFLITVALILFILFLLYEINRHYHTAKKKEQQMDAGRRSRFNFIFTILITLGLMVFDVILNTRIVYNASVAGTYEDGRAVVMSTATELENYLVAAESTLRVVADTIDIMVREGYSSQDILQYLTDQTKKQSEQFDENFTGLYAFIDGEYMDGSGWVPPEGYDPMSREWYRTAAEAEKETVIISPCLDAQTGSVVITFTKNVSSGKEKSDPSIHNMVSLDVLVSYMQELVEEVNIAGKGYGMVVNTGGFIIAHKDRELVGQNISDIYGREILDRIARAGNRSFKMVLDYEEYTFFTYPILGQWDAYDAMTSRRSYRGVMPQRKAREEIEKGSGTQFDPRFAKVMILLIDEDTSYSMREK